MIRENSDVRSRGKGGGKNPHRKSGMIFPAVASMRFEHFAAHTYLRYLAYQNVARCRARGIDRW